MKTAIVTFVRACNYGAVLQCYALAATLSKLGSSPIVVDYWPSYFRRRYYLDGWAWREVLTRKIGISAWKDRAWEKILKSKRNQAFERFISERIPLSDKRATRPQGLADCALTATLWVTGSDQVWSPTCAEFDPAFFLDFPLPPDARKCSYAASFGTAHIPAELQEEYRRRLHDYTAYSVREQKGADLLQEFLPGCDCSVHCDPTLLLSREEWELLAAPQQTEKKYILLYHALPADSLLLDTAERLSRETGASIIDLSSYFSAHSVRELKKHCPCAELRYTAGPAEFLALFRDAAYVLTNSFHGTVFSILFRKQFLSQIEMLNGGHNGRSEALLETLGLENRVLAPTKGAAIHEAILWEQAEQQLNTMRANAINYLRRQCEMAAVPGENTATFHIS